MKLVCRSCGAENEVGETVGRRDSCERCLADLRACVQCRHYEPGYHNDCRENQAELVVDKEKANFCDFFQAATGQAKSTGGSLSKDEAAAQWENLFGKK